MRKQEADLHLGDLFCGGGGLSTGTARACRLLGRSTHTVAVNHWDIAARTYKRNHPQAKVLCTGLDSVIPTEEVPGGRLSLLAASPECTHHSNARGGRPMSDQSRASAWLILKWLQELYVEAFLIENVHEFADWGPLGADGRPMKRMRGQLFDQFIRSLKALGYNVEWRTLNAADYGGATTRERLFIMGRRGRNKRLIWPDKTHAQLGDLQPEMFGNEKRRWKSAREIIDWSMPSQSIFTRKKPLARATMERIAAGLRKFGGKNAEPFLVVLRNHMAAQSLNVPLPTITAGGRHIGLCEPKPFVMSMEHSRGSARPFVLPVNHGAGDHRVFDPDNPMPTITTVDAWGAVQPFMITAGGPIGQGRTPKDISEPMPTVLTDDHHALIQPYLIEYRGNHAGRDDGHRRVASLDSPLPTQDTSNRFGVVEPLICSYYGTQNISRVSAPLPTVTTKDRFGLVEFDGMLLDIHFRMLQWNELAAAMGFPSDYFFEGTRDQKVKQIGNSVHVDVAEALAISALAA